ncbi:MAG TPA: peptide chain release factor N(5)-glutamine methyltransferase [Terracidiphilus sp.]|nr:peptide chain release factor N(5)-glutamine methyltransferase [Terracidiphilus sp.]
MKLEDWLKNGEEQLAAGPHPDRARRDAEQLLLHVVRRNRAALLAHSKEELDDTLAARYLALLGRRLTGEPIQYIFGQTEFYGLPLRVTRDVLIPRPETEHLVEKVIELASRYSEPRIVDVGTGSGAIAVALAHKLPDAHVTAIDLSAAALAIAQENAELNGVADRIRFLHGDLLAPVAEEQFDIVVSNPPYVPDADHASLSVEVRDYEPAQALFAGSDGLSVYRRLIPAACAVLVSGGWLALEIGHGQSVAIRALLAGSGLHPIEFVADLQGIPRVASGRRH